MQPQDVDENENASVEQGFFPYAAAGRDAGLITLEADGFSVTLSPLGAALLSARLAGRELAYPVGEPAERQALAPHYIGVTMGPYSRIIRGGTFKLGDETIRLSCNAGGHHLHGGEAGLDRAVWRLLPRRTERPHEGLFSLIRRPGIDGYPGRATMLARYALGPGPRLTVDYAARTDAPTLMGPTAHLFFNLEGGGTIDGHRLTIGRGRLVEQDAAFLPSGRLGEDDGPHRLDLDRRRLDRCYALPPARPGQLVEACTLAAPAAGRTLTVHTDQPCLALYSGDGLPQPRRALCLQTGPLPDAPNIPGFPSAILRPGETFRSRTVFAFATAS